MAKMMLYLTLGAVVLIGVYGTLIYRIMSTGLGSEMESRLSVISDLAMKEIAASDLQFLAFNGSLNTKYQQALGKIKQETGVNDILIITPDKKVVFSLLDESERFFVNVDAFEITGAFEGKEVFSPLYRGAQGKHYKTGYAPIKSGEKIVAVVGIEASVIYEAFLNRFRQALFIVSLLTLIAAIVLSYHISGSIVRSIKLLKEKAQRIAIRDFDENIKVTSQDELRELEAALDAMKSDLRDYIEEKEKLATAGEFAAGVAHEIRNSLSVVSGYAELISENSSDKKVLKYAEDIYRNSAKMSEFLNNFLTYTKDFEPDLHGTDMAALVKALVSEFKKEMRNAMEMKFPQGTVTAKVDEYLIKKALHNILLNAYQALDKKEKQITISLESKNNKAVIKIKDNGKGIEAGQKEKIFQPFVTGRKEGSGLGLAIAYKIIHEIHNGTITVDSETGKGSEFTITL
jgi:signal transduction histidine kinase